jgi:hypothetical protein
VFKHAEVVNGEDPNDLISDVEIVERPKASRKTSVQVVIHPTSRYQGTSFKEPPRVKSSTGQSKPFTKTPSQTDLTSSYFNGNDGGRKANANSEVASVLNKPGRTRQQNRLSTQKNGAFSISNGRRESYDSLDELSLDNEAQHRKAAQQLLTQRKQADGSSAAANAQMRYSVDSDNSEDEHKRANILTTTLPGKRKPAKLPGQDRFSVIQVFSERTAWLFPERSKPWYIIQNCKAGILTVFNDEDDAVKDLELVPTSIKQVHRNEKDGKVLLIKAADRTAKNADKICLELGDSDQSEDFCKNFKAFSSEISNGMKTP